MYGDAALDAALNVRARLPSLSHTINLVSCSDPSSSRQPPMACTLATIDLSTYAGRLARYWRYVTDSAGVLRECEQEKDQYVATISCQPPSSSTSDTDSEEEESELSGPTLSTTISGQEQVPVSGSSPSLRAEMVGKTPSPLWSSQDRIAAEGGASVRIAWGFACFSAPSTRVRACSSTLRQRSALCNRLRRKWSSAPWCCAIPTILSGSSVTLTLRNSTPTATILRST